MGGRAAGERASQIAVETVLGYFQHDLHGADTQILGKTFESVSQRANALNRAIQLANQAIHEEAARNPVYAGMGSTIVAVLVEGNLFSLANVGDSRVYYLPAAGGIRQISHDDTHVGWLFRNGRHRARRHQDEAYLGAALLERRQRTPRYKTSSCGRWAQRRALSRIWRTMSLRQETSCCFAVMACHATSRKAF